jgi:eukaryotic-like serine/threonine-protein kinase
MFPQIFGKYVLEREIAAGGMARVYLATLRGAVGFEKRLVVKQIRPELACDEAFVRRFVEEAKTAVELNHPNIVPVFELGVEGGVYYLAMEFCPGLTLADVLTQTGPLDPAEGAHVGAEVCRALDYAHRRAGIVHRDVTPRNVLVDDEGAVRIIDFGIAAPVERSGRRSREIFGSPGHMPPEQLRGDPLTPATDVFAVGALLIEAWTGKPPFRRGTPKESAKALETPPPPIDADQSELAPLARLLLTTVSPNPASRPADAEQLARPLRDFLRATDSGDLTRRLGERVRRARIRLGEGRPSRPPAPRDGADGSVPPPATPGSLTASRTFAARDELAVWTRRLGSGAPPPSDSKSDLSTRRLNDGPSSGPPSVAPRDPASGPTARHGSSAYGSTPPVRRSGIATRPSARPGRGGLGLLSRSALAVLFTLAGALFAFGLTRLFASPPPATSAVATPAPVLPARLAATQPVSAELAERNQDVARVPTSQGAVSSAKPAASVPRAASSAASEKSARASVEAAPSARVDAAGEPNARPATLRLTADPPAMVTVEGAGVSRTTPTPVAGLELVPGSYRVVFRNETYGPPVATRVELVAGALLRVHADFREAEPRVTVR